MHILKVANLPFGFYDEQLLGYFTQYGKVLRVRVPRHKKSGFVVGTGFVAFEDRKVAEIAAESMDGYILYEKILRCKLLAQENVPACMRLSVEKKILPGPKIHAKKKKSTLLKQANIGPTAERNMVINLLNRIVERNAKLEQLGVDYRYDFKLFDDRPTATTDVVPGLTAADLPEDEKPKVAPKKTKQQPAKKRRPLLAAAAATAAKNAKLNGEEKSTRPKGKLAKSKPKKRKASAAK